MASGDCNQLLAGYVPVILSILMKVISNFIFEKSKWILDVYDALVLPFVIPK